MSIVKVILVVLLSVIQLELHAQNELNKLYLHYSLSLKDHGQVGLYGQAFNYFTAGILYSGVSVDTGPRVVREVNGKDITYQLQNKSNNLVVLFGVSTSSKKFYDIAAFVGPSYNSYVVKENILFSDFGDPHFEYDRLEFGGVGLALRVNGSIAFTKIVGLHIGFDSNINGKVDYYKFSVGLNFGLIRDKSLYKKIN